MSVSEETKLFILEAYENIDSIEEMVLGLEKNPENHAALNEVFRYIHTLKGNSGFLGFGKLEDLCNGGESLLHLGRSGAVVLSGEAISALLFMIDTLRTTLAVIETEGSDDRANVEPATQKVNQCLQEARERV